MPGLLVGADRAAKFGTSFIFDFLEDLEKREGSTIGGERGG